MNHLIIGNKNYSSWSLRPWLLLKEKGIEFRETKIALYLEESKQELLNYSPAGKVPVYFYKEIPVWDSLSICETIAEIYPEKHCWPSTFDLRALARSVSAEMHSGFSTIRNTLPMNCRTKMIFHPISTELQFEVDRICEIWRNSLDKSKETGPFLFGDFSIADAMFAPIVLRFNSYGIRVGKSERHYMNTILNLDSVKEWIAEGIQEVEMIEESEIRQNSI
ncbi:MAG: glutathione S-transferase family protein [Kangiellaceae bacterium]|nr:glutathione S-transferase family protein [Kangiellaceae bacterium]